MVELFGVRFCHLPSQVFAGSSEPVRPREHLSPDEPSPREPTLAEDFSKCPRTPSLDFHQIRIRRPSIPDCWHRRHVSVAPTQIDCCRKPHDEHWSLEVTNGSRPSSSEQSLDSINGLLAYRIEFGDYFFPDLPSIQRKAEERDYSRKPPLSTDKPLSWHPARPANRIVVVKPRPFTLLVSKVTPGAIPKRNSQLQSFYDH